LLFGLIFALSGSFLGLRAMDKMDIVNLVEKTAEICPTWQEVGIDLYCGKLTSKKAKAYVFGRLEFRLNYWKDKYKKVLARYDKISKENPSSLAFIEWRNDWLEIPPYIKHNQNIKVSGMLNDVFVISDIRAQFTFDTYCHEDVMKERELYIYNYDRDHWKYLNNGLGFFFSFPNKTMWLKDFWHGEGWVDYDIFDFFATIEHELTHVEQLANGEVCRSKCSYNFDKNTGYLFTHHDAMTFLGQGSYQGPVFSSNSFAKEYEADSEILSFHPNLYGYYCLESYLSGMGQSNPLVDDRGYWSAMKFLVEMQNMKIHENQSLKKEVDDFLKDLNDYDCGVLLAQERYEKNLQFMNGPVKSIKIRSSYTVSK
jgi:hypothetical protein